MEELFAKYTLKYLKSIKEWWNNKDVQIPEVHQESNSHFVSNAEQMNSVYEIRDSIFGGDQLSGDAYDAFLNKNEFAITLLSFNTPNKKSSPKIGPIILSYLFQKIHMIVLFQIIKSIWRLSRNLYPGKKLSLKRRFIFIWLELLFGKGYGIRN